MKGLRLAALVTVLVSAASVASAASVGWHDSIDEGLEQARRLNRPVWLDFWATWCAPCHVMDREVYTDPGVVRASEPFVAVRIDFDKKTLLARKYHVEALPTMVFTDSDGNELFRYSGAIGAAPLTELLRTLPRDVGEFTRLNRVLAGDRNNFAALQRMATAMKAAGLYRTSLEFFQRALQQSDVKTNPAVRAALLNDLGSSYLEIKEGRQAALVFTRCLKEFPDSAQTLDWRLNLGRSYALDTNSDKARKYLATFVREHPTTPQAATAARLLESLGATGVK